MKRMSKFRIPGLSFSWKRAVGISGVKTRIARKTGIPLTRGGIARKIGETFLRLFKVFAVSLVITPTFADRLEVEVDNEGANLTQIFMVVPFDAVGK